MSKEKPKATISKWLTGPLSRDIIKSVDRITKTEDVQHVALMPDVHLAKEVCIGTVVATKRLIFPASVGGDIGCGMAAVCFDSDADILTDEQSAAQLLSGLGRCVPTNRHGTATMPDTLPEVLDQSPLSFPKLEKEKRRDGRVQFGTLGRGNHFLEFQADHENRLWLMVHSGSRAMGQVISVHHLQHADKTSTGLACFDSDSETGQAYLSDMNWGLLYAEKNRLAMVDIVEILMQDLFGISLDRSTLFHSHHNHVLRESHFGEEYWIHRKGAQSAQNDEPGIIPGSMGTASFHVTGRGFAESLCSSSHGAGRKQSRTEARKTVGSRNFQRQMGSVWFDNRKANALRDEAPSSYKDIHAVMRAQKKLTRIIRELRPLLCYKGV